MSHTIGTMLLEPENRMMPVNLLTATAGAALEDPHRPIGSTSLRGYPATVAAQGER